MLSTIYTDVETDGIRDDCQIIQLAAIAVGPQWEELGALQMKVQFDETLAEPEALKINHYDPEVWKAEAVSKTLTVAKFAQFVEGYKVIQLTSKRTGQPYSVARLAGFNAATFDGPRLRRMFGERFFPCHPVALDVLHLALWTFHLRADKPENYKLETLAKYFRIETPQSHDALADVRTTIALAKRLLDVTGKESYGHGN
jgi:exonuclease I